jgi:general secretion pathway protein H
MTLPREREAGFTLIEMIAVLVVAGLLIGLVIARGPMRSRTLDAKAASGEIAMALREARAQAIGADEPVSVTLDLKGHAYQIGNRPPRALPKWIELAITTATGEARGGERPGILFEPDGSSTGGEIKLTDGPTKFRILVDWLSGRVRVADAK